MVLQLIDYGRRSRRWWPNLALVLLLLWGLFIVYATMLPFDFSASGELIQSRLRRLWQRPLRGGGGSWSDVVSNVLLFMPWGFLLAVWLAGRGGRYLAVVTVALLSGALLSGTVELVAVIRPQPLHFVRRPGDQHVRRDRGGLGRLARGAVDLAVRVGPHPAVARFASPDGCALATAVGLVVAG